MAAARITILTLLAGATVANGDTFLGVQHTRASTEEDFRSAMSIVMGCGGDEGRDMLASVEEDLLPMWRVLPKTQEGFVEWRMVRYLAHRYFMQQSSLLVRGFEPMRQINSSHMGGADIFNEKVPSIVDAVLESKRSSKGFSLQEAAAMIATLGQLIRDAEGTLLAKVYRQQRKSTKQSLSHTELENLVEAYMIHWMMDDDQQVIRLLLANRTLLHTALPKWPQIKGFVDGVVKGMEFGRQRAAQPGHGPAALGSRYSFDDAHEAVSSITKNFASFWESECQVIKDSLVGMDTTGTGRVSLSDFYGANADGEWRFGESEAYLRELGALDESSAWRGKQVIIPNYIQSASNCIVATPHYLVCCTNECEAVLNEIEDAIGAPVAEPELILPLVGNMTNFDDEAPKVDEALKLQLGRIAETHGGKVPLHGRLFTQWLHYVFPQECPFPHKTGSTTAVTPLQFGDSYIVSEADVSSHAASRNESLPAMAQEVQLMSQWSEEEELIADYSLELTAPWDSTKRNALAAGAAVIASILLAAGAVSGSSKSAPACPFEKAHYV